MAKSKKPPAPEQDAAERDRLIDEATRDRLTGGDDEGAAWAKAFGGPGLQEQTPAEVPPLTAEEAASLRDLMIYAAEQGDAAALERLKALAADPAELRRVMDSFDPDA